jgi:hypothetical protein
MPVVRNIYKYTYLSDDGNSYNTKLSPAYALAGGFNPGAAGQPLWARKTQTKNIMRRFHVISADGTQKKVVEFAAQGAFATAIKTVTSLMIGSVSYNITGWEGERQEVIQNPSS